MRAAIPHPVALISVLQSVMHSLTGGDMQSDSSNGSDKGDLPSGDNETLFISDILEKLRDEARNTDGDSLTLGDAMTAFGSRTFGPMLVIPAFLALVPPLGAIPGMSIFTATWIVLVAGQIVLMQSSLWLPKRLKQFSLKQDKLERGIKRAMPWVKRIEILIHPRLEILTRGPAKVIIAVVCIGLAVTMFPLAFIPMGVAPPSAVILLLAVAITTRDGILVILAAIGGGAASYFMYAWLIAG